MDTGKPLVLYDGACRLCQAAVRFVAARDPKARFSFAPLQSDLGREMLRAFQLSEADLSTVVLLEGGRAYVRSVAWLRVMRLVRWPWPVLYAGVLIPAPLRDWAYGIVARHRDRFWGRRVPGHDRRDRREGSGSSR